MVCWICSGGESHPGGVSSRMILAFWWLFTILIVSSYTANLAAFLTVTILDKPIDTLEDLAHNDEITPLVKTGTNIYSLFRVCMFGLNSSIIKRRFKFLCVSLVQGPARGPFPERRSHYVVSGIKVTRPHARACLVIFIITVHKISILPSSVFIAAEKYCCYC